MSEHKAMNLLTRKPITVTCPDEACHEQGHQWFESDFLAQFKFTRHQAMRTLRVRLCMACGANESKMLTKRDMSRIKQERLEYVAKKDGISVEDVVERERWKY